MSGGLRLVIVQKQLVDLIFREAGWRVEIGGSKLPGRWLTGTAWAFPVEAGCFIFRKSLAENSKLAIIKINIIKL